jgi:hypothetical protein
MSTTTNGKTAKKVSSVPNRLTLVNGNKVCNWLEANKEYIERTSDTIATLALTCKDVTGVSVSESTLKHLMNEMGIKKKRQNIIGSKLKNVAELHRKIDALAKYLEVEFVAIADGQYKINDLRQQT